LLGLVALGAAVVGSGLYHQLNLDTLAREHQTLAAWAERHPVLACAALVLSVATIISTGLPGSIVIIVAGGVILGTLKGALLAATGDTTGALILYFAARRLFMTRSTQPPALVKRIRAGFEQNPASFAFFIRLVPIFPFGATSVALAWLGCRLRLFVTSSWLGVLPSSFIYASIGAGLGGALEAHESISLNILAEPRFLLPLAGLGALALLPALFGLRRKPGPGTPPRP
jgi:uncharacterized membrane protein YdjX (TVP38/TMEM64 family)